MVASVLYTAHVSGTYGTYAYVPSTGSTYQVLGEVTGVTGGTRFLENSAGFMYYDTTQSGGNDRLVLVSENGEVVLSKDSSGNDFYLNSSHINIQHFHDIGTESVFEAHTFSVPNDSSRKLDVGGDGLFVTDGANAPRMLFGSAPVQDVHQVGNKFVINTAQFDRENVTLSYGLHLVDTSGQSQSFSLPGYEDSYFNITEVFELNGEIYVAGKYSSSHAAGGGVTVSDFYRLDTSSGRLIKSGIVNDHVAVSNFDSSVVSVYVPDSSSGYFYFWKNVPDQADHQLFRSDGTSAGTQLVASNYAGVSPGSSGEQVSSVGGHVVYAGIGGETGNQIVSTDGTQTGTGLISGENTPVGWVSATLYSEFINVGDKIVISAAGNSAGELFSTDGTLVGTSAFYNFNLQSDGSSSGSYTPNLFFSHDGLAYFTLRNSGEHESAALWATDGTAGNTRIVSVAEGATGYLSSLSLLDLDTSVLVGAGTVPTSGDDVFLLLSSMTSLDGGQGFDKLTIDAAKNAISISNDGDGTFTLIVNSRSVDLSNLERIQLNDGVVALDLTGSSGQTYRLYQAAFDRTPDDAGLSHNVNLMDQGLSIFDMANAFIASQEFQNAYGADINDTQFLTLLYQNVLNRAPDQAGLDGWLSRLGSGTERKEVLFGFSESTENKATVAPAIDDGIWLA